MPKFTMNPISDSDASIMNAVVNPPVAALMLPVSVAAKDAGISTMLSMPKFIGKFFGP